MGFHEGLCEETVVEMDIMDTINKCCWLVGIGWKTEEIHLKGD